MLVKIIFLDLYQLILVQVVFTPYVFVLQHNLKKTLFYFFLKKDFICYPTNAKNKIINAFQNDFYGPLWSYRGITFCSFKISTLLLN